MKLPPARATAVIVAVTALAWAAAASAGLTQQVALLAGFIPARIAEGAALPHAVPAWLTPLSCTLVHAGILHVGFNMLILGFCGRFVEPSIGWNGFVLLYIVGAYAAAAGEYAVGPHIVVPMIGASGAVSAVIGAYALLFGQRKAKAWGPIPATAIHVLWLAIAWIGLQALIGFASAGVPGVPAGTVIAVPAHIGGFIAGLILARPLLLFRYRKA
ncbi:MAG TPA: rhomboid family intramembrane serine protease [Sphingomonas sp.]|nr:rhomboid family intramembrane serine protease [Sphingomonas sp.]